MVACANGVRIGFCLLAGDGRRQVRMGSFAKGSKWELFFNQGPYYGVEYVVRGLWYVIHGVWEFINIWGPDLDRDVGYQAPKDQSH